ncbi:MAG: TlpA family protein disulfide reductase [Bacteroidales bacterium]|nr:TlpA family protein disulfide reductase [Bacteroidales bacterium]
MTKRTHIRTIAMLLALVLGTAGTVSAQQQEVQYGKENISRDYCKGYKITINAEKECNSPIALYSCLFGEWELMDNTAISKGKAVFSKTVPAASKSDVSSLIPKGFYKIVATDTYVISDAGGEYSYDVEYGTSILLNQQTSVDLSMLRAKQTFEVLSSEENKVLFATTEMMNQQDGLPAALQAGVELNSSAPQSFYAQYLSLNKEIVDVMLSVSFRYSAIEPSVFHKVLSSVDFTDGRLCHSESFLFPLIQGYLLSDSRESASEIINEVDSILTRAARGGRYQCGLYAQWLYGIFDQTGDPYYEPVLLHIYDTYDRGWIPEDQERRIKRQMDRIRKLAPGAQIPELTAFDINGKQHSTNEIQTKYTILWFWDPDCDHCQEETPVLHDLYQKEADHLNFEVFAVEVNDDYDRWKAFSEKHGLSDWINLSTSMGETSVDYIEYFDIVTTPVILLIDNEKNHTIKARQTTLDEIVRLMK